MKGFNDLERERDRANWERTRALGVWILSPHAPKGKILKPKDIMRFEWDKTWIEENKEILKQADEIARKHGK